MKILQLCKKFPFPVKDGESIAVSYLAKALNEQGAEVTLLAMNTHKHWVDTDHLPEGMEHYRAVQAVDVDNRIKPIGAFVNLFTDNSYHIERFIDQQFTNKLVEQLQHERFDVVQLETLYLAPYIPFIRKHSNAIIVLRSHNVEHEIWERVALNSTPLKRWYLEHITPKLKRYEIQALNNYDLMVGITQRDVDQFKLLGLNKPSVVCPIGLDSRDYQPDYDSYRRPLSLSFIGSLDWMPNLEGLQWFLENVWTPLLQPRFPKLTLHIAGRNTPSWLLRQNLPGVTVHGEVESARAFINQHSAMVVPLLSGSGMRAKILEGMALGKVVISSRIGMEGITIENRCEALLADQPQDYVDAVQWCYDRQKTLEQTGRLARNCFEKNFDNFESAGHLLEAYRELKEVRSLKFKV